MSLPSWLKKGLKLPYLKWVVGVIAVLVVAVVVVFRMMLTYKRRLQVAKEVRSVETSYDQQKNELKKGEKNQKDKLRKEYDNKIAVLNVKSAELDHAAHSGNAALAELVNLTFKGGDK